MTTEGTGPEQFGSYLMLEQIGDGGMAEIFLAKMQGYSGFEKLVALKRILPRYSQNPAFAKMLIHEAKLAARIQHNNVVQVLDLGEASGRVYIAMEYIRGRDLAAILSNTYRRKEFLPVPLALFVSTEFLTGLDFAHRLSGTDGRPLGLIHRDISPQNILISFEGEVKVTDFGIARVIEFGEGESLPGNLHGKFGYMSPEQVRNQGLDQRSDVFSSGIVVHEMLTGKRLFRGKTPQATVELVLRHKIPLPSSINPDVPKEIDDIVMRSLAREANERYQTIGALLGDLSRASDAMRARAQRRDLAVYMRRQFGAKNAQKRRASISPYSPSPGTRVPLGEILVRKGAITYDELEIALAEQRARGGRIGEILVEANNITEEMLTGALAEQSSVAVLPAAQLKLQRPDDSVLARFPRAMAQQISVLALSVDAEGRAVLAVTDPYDNRSLLEAKVVLGVEEADIRLVTRTAFREMLQAWYPRVTEPPKVAKTTIEAPPPPPVPSGPAVVLFADANVADIEPLAQRIKAEECEVMIAKDGKKAREIIRSSNPIIAFLDAALPAIDGYNILLELRSKNPEAAIFITSSRKDEFREAKALELGADDFLVKPFSLEVTASKVRRELQKRATTRRAPAGAVPMFRGVSGSLGDMSVVDVVQSLEVGRKTAHVVLQYEDGRSGELRVDDGDVRGCRAGEATGEEAFYKLAPSGDGIFRIEYRSSDVPININSVNTALVLEALRREDASSGAQVTDIMRIEDMIPDGPQLLPPNLAEGLVLAPKDSRAPDDTPKFTPVHPQLDPRRGFNPDPSAFSAVSPSPSPSPHPSQQLDPRTQTGAWRAPDPSAWPMPSLEPRTQTGAWAGFSSKAEKTPWPSPTAWPLPQVSSPAAPPPPSQHTPLPPLPDISGSWPRPDLSAWSPPTASGTHPVLARGNSGLSPPPAPLPRTASGVSPPPALLPRGASGLTPPPAPLPPGAPGRSPPPLESMVSPLPRAASGLRPPPLPKARGQSGVQAPPRLDQPRAPSADVSGEFLPPMPADTSTARPIVPPPSTSMQFYLDPATGELVVGPPKKDKGGR
ncbi:MAG: protein kinase [Deltaproteobacteria bacterium]|nr:protein kinase [Deltaproteobacteria bacterium]